MRYDTNAFMRSMLALMLALVLGGAMTAVAASESNKNKQACKEQSGEQCEQPSNKQGKQQSSGQGDDDGGYGDFDPTKSFGSALSDDNEEGEEQQ